MVMCRVIDDEAIEVLDTKIDFIRFWHSDYDDPEGARNAALGLIVSTLKSRKASEVQITMLDDDDAVEVIITGQVEDLTSLIERAV